MRVSLLFLSVLVLVSTESETDASWDCQFTFDGYYYDLTPGNDNNDAPWFTSDPYDDYYFKLCEPTTNPTYSLSSCLPGTQVCQRGLLDHEPHDYSCGVNPTTSSYGDTPGQGVVMYSKNGSTTGCAKGRETYLQVLCPSHRHPSGTFGPVLENPECVYTIPFYHHVGCPVKNPSNTAALASLYQSTDGPNWKNKTNWLSPADPTGCSWHGVSCDSDSVITGLSLYDNNLAGTFPLNFNALTSLQNIFLQNNSLIGPIPDLSGVSGLVNLYLSGNMLSGPFPKVTSIPSLAELDLHSNKLSGNIPYDICNVDYFNIIDNAWDCPLPPCCQSPVYEKARCGKCQWP